MDQSIRKRRPDEQPDVDGSHDVDPHQVDTQHQHEAEGDDGDR